MTSSILTSSVRRLAFATALAAQLLPIPVHANGRDIQTVGLQTHASQGEVRPVEGGSARLARTSDGIFLDVAASDLTPGNAYTLWIVAINAPERCENAPCTSADVMKLTETVEADLGYGDGSIAGSDGDVRFAAFQPMGAMSSSWFGRGLTNPDAEIHVVIRDHGPLQAGKERAMLSTFRAGCADASVPETLPVTARSDGSAGPYACGNVQAAIFAP